MLGLPMYLVSASLMLTGAATRHANSGIADIPDCPINFYGIHYDRLYINLTNTIVCFTGFSGVAHPGECIEIGTSADDFDVKTRRNSSHCQLTLTFYSRHSSVELQCSERHDRPDDPQQHCQAHVTSDLQTHMVVRTDINGHYLDEWPLKRHITKEIKIYGCRFSGRVLRQAEVMTTPDNCVQTTCIPPNLQHSEQCAHMETCLGNGQCSPDTICTVTASTVIDIHGHSRAIPDRCTYTLMTFSSELSFSIEANFQEQRRRDVSLLHHVILQEGPPGTRIRLEQGGRVRVNDKLIAVNNVTQAGDGAIIVPDHGGVLFTIKTHDNTSASVYFNGLILQIHAKGVAPETLQGLCTSSNQSLSDLRVPLTSNASCDVQYSDPADSSIDCKLMTQRCNVLKEAPFTGCNKYTDPAPYISACTDTLCKYPAVDGIGHCQFLEAYASNCQHYGVSLEGWRSTANCSAPQNLCPDHICAAHEFCGMKVEHGETGCFCRAIYLNEHEAIQNNLVCSESSALVTIPTCVLESKGINYTTLHLKDDTCKGQEDSTTHMVTFGFNSTNACGTLVTSNGTHVIYKNAIIDRETSDIIVRTHEVLIDFSCFYNQPDLQMMTVTFKDSSVVRHLNAAPWRYTLTMKAYTNAARTRAINPSTVVHLNQRIWVELKAQGLARSFVALLAESCWATNEPQPNASLRHDLIVRSCANRGDETVEVESKRTGNLHLLLLQGFPLRWENWQGLPALQTPPLYQENFHLLPPEMQQEFKNGQICQD